ncbi:ammonium transporter [Roseivirga sp. BDSF3-8]|uniref:ammonium transporter n=1 Tax=Roseivirga sp. BDSF3-8 TaxID=3241598 RepID=UPI0035327380
MNTSEFLVHNLWLMLATLLVFVMHLGFAGLEAGLTRQKNTVNILFKNTLVPGIGLLTYALVGFNLMYPGEGAYAGVFGFRGFGLIMPTLKAGVLYNQHYTFLTEFIFQAMFAATAATIVSGAVAERIKISSFLLFACLYVGLCYPIVGMWKWGGGWLNQLSTPFYDFAGSTLVHAVGGWAALAGTLILGPRIGRYEVGARFGGHSLPLATIGVFLLWFGWFGFNGGSVLSADPEKVSQVFVNTAMGGAAGMLGAFIMSYAQSRLYDLGMVLNGVLAGLVSVTAGADVFHITHSLWAGLVGGGLVVLFTHLMNRLRIDDPVGAVPVHLVCGIWGTLAIGMFGPLAGWSQFLSQVTGTVAIGTACLSFSIVVFMLIRKTLGLRVSPKVEIEGLDRSEHGQAAYEMEDYQRHDAVPA